MNQATDGMLAALFGVAMTSPAEAETRLAALLSYARESQAADFHDARDAAIREATRLLQRDPRPDASRRALESRAHELGQFALDVGRPSLAREAFVRQVALLQGHDSGVALGVAWHGIGNTWNAEGRSEEALAAYRRAAEVEIGSGADDVSRSVTLLAIATMESELGRPDRCAEQLSRAIGLLADAAKTGGLHAGRALRAARNTARWAAENGHVATAREALDVAIRAAETTDDARLVGILEAQRGDTWPSAEADEHTLAAYHRAVELLQDDAPLDYVGRLLVRRAEAEGHAGTPDTCATAVDEGVERLQSLAQKPEADVRGIAVVALRLGRAARPHVSPARARTAFEFAYGLLDAPEHAVARGVVAHDLGESWSADGDHEQARAWFRNAVTLKAGGDAAPLDRAFTAERLAAIEQRCGDRAPCEEALRVAMTCLGETRARSDDDRTAAVEVAQAVAATARWVGGAVASDAADLERRLREGAPDQEENSCPVSGDEPRVHMVTRRRRGSRAHTLAEVWRDVGDRHFARGSLPQARAAYQAALRAVDAADPLAGILPALALADVEERAGDEDSLAGALGQAEDLLEAADPADARYAARLHGFQLRAAGPQPDRADDANAAERGTD